MQQKREKEKKLSLVIIIHNFQRDVVVHLIYGVTFNLCTPDSCYTILSR